MKGWFSGYGDALPFLTANTKQVMGLRRRRRAAAEADTAVLTWLCWAAVTPQWTGVRTALASWRC
ncbi:hypothetical protein KCP73_20385 [Salmonella enterica subsp. enterica]|nr:hypothetical protein KCP73_20385 [Salmonella enterica subsp. enterica]